MFIWAMHDKGSEWKAIASFLAEGEMPFTPLVEAVCEPVLHSGKSPMQAVRNLAQTSRHCRHSAEFG